MTKRTAILIVAVICCAITLALLLAVAALLPDPPAPTQPTQTTTVPTTEATLPPPTENVFTPLDFGYEGDYLTCLTDESWLGIDVSSHQGDINWDEVKAAGIEYVMIRVAFRGYGEKGTLLEDAKAKENYEAATAAGLKVGVYIFSQAITVEEAVEEAEFVLQLIDGWNLEMPVAYDWECLAEDYRTVDADARTVTDCAKAFCETIRQAGYETMIYFNPNQSRERMYLEELVDYGFWLAMYSDLMTYEYKIDMWQYTKEGSVPGIQGHVDIDLYFPYGAENE